jgi:hypothetical protein
VRPGWAVWLLSAGGVALSLCGVAALSVVVALVLTVVGSTACVLWLGHDFRSVIIAARH